MQLEDLSRKLDDDDELADLLARALRTGGAARSAAKRAAFAEILAGAIDGDRSTRIVAGVFLKIMEELDEEHVQIMNKIAELYIRPLAQGGQQAVVGVTPDELVAALPI